MNQPTDLNAANTGDAQWYKDAVIYQLHVKSFFDANDDGVGDFAGLLAKLDYIASLGVNTIWLLPFYPSPRRDDGYDIAQYRGVHEDYGSLADVRRFIRAAHVKGLRVITELVVNHTSDQHPWFQRARRAKPGSAARSFYVWSDSDQKYAGTRIIFLDTETSNWTWDPVAGAYFWHRFYSHQPDLNFDNPQVLMEVLSVMRFWLDLGVDGLRLDAVPYLIEREGTNNENLPETHAVLKRIRAEIETHYPGRMLLAEANQWPEDAQEYFGDGDECHMSFHFPLMPRMYMAIARGDRFPITDIMRQTPDIPEACQWAIFLRNHDELTLEMVTSSERDYLWDVYASDRRARINLGIRRRLSPLLERDRRRIELMNSLLLSMPGTPVVYYGDELGMGDNIHLGDRDGVRTPMQWSPDRNGGFSRADPERLPLPVLMGPLYGYEAVNVEAQQRDPHSLLNWTRRMLAKRQQTQVFGRGSLTFLYPGNRRILAYLREFEGTTILCVANLSAASQPVELDLSALDGRVPVELLDGTPFPAIGRLPYLLTLPPYGFYWFDLSERARPPDWHANPPEQMPEYATLVLRGAAGYNLTEGSSRALRDEVLPRYLTRQRWFAKHHAPTHAEPVYATALGGKDETFLAEFDVQTESGTARYFLPLALLWTETLPTLTQQYALARVRRGPEMGMVTDAFSLKSFSHALLENFRQSRQIAVTPPQGTVTLTFLPEPGLAEIDVAPDADVKWFLGEQSNSSMALDGKLMMKLVRKLADGMHPEAEMTRRLTHVGYANCAALLGELVRKDDQGGQATLALVHANVPNQGDAWAWTSNYLDQVLQAAALTEQTVEHFIDELGGYMTVASAIGRRLGELHDALALPCDDPAFAPECASEADAQAWADDIVAMLDRARQALETATPSGEAAAARDTVLGNSRAVDAEVRRLAARMAGTLRTRIHGDFHLGQVLVSQGDAYLIDFEGEPARSMAERRQKNTPLRDVAGLLRSFDYARAAFLDKMRTLEGGSETASPSAPPAQGAQTALRSPADQALHDRRDALLDRFRDNASDAFLAAYREQAARSANTWIDPDTLDLLLPLALLEKAAYEVVYEASHRPGWLSIPLTGLAALTSRLLAIDSNKDK